MRSKRLFSVIMSDRDFMYFIGKVKPECDQIICSCTFIQVRPYEMTSYPCLY
jgi:hypothetical protein